MIQPRPLWQAQPRQQSQQEQQPPPLLREPRAHACCRCWKAWMLRDAKSWIATSWLRQSPWFAGRAESFCWASQGPCKQR